MPATTSSLPLPANAALSSPAHLHSSLAWVRLLLTCTGFGLAIVAVLAFQQFLIQIYVTRWQMALLFALVGLMVSLLLGQYRLDRSQIQTDITRWSSLSSLFVTLLGLGVVVCVLTTTPPIG